MPETVTAKRVLLGLSEAELERVAAELGLPAYVGRQLAHWLYVRGAADFGMMTNLSREARALLAERCALGRSAPVRRQASADGTVKYLYGTVDGHFVETVFIPDGERATLCVSCQVGCRMGCRFCMTGRQGLQAQLSASDILNQFLSLPERERLTNVVFMGQGEPLDNLEAVLRAVGVLTREMGWSPKRVTVSTVGLCAGLQRLLEECRCHVAVSLHHPLPEGRAELMPAERAFPARDIVALLRQYDFCRKRPVVRGPKQRRLSFEYIVFDGLNDSVRHAAALVRLLDGLDCRVNLIRFHDIPDSPLRGVGEERMVRFRDYLTAHGVFTTIRASRGQDIDAACGLLSTKAQEEQT
ncbi:MAG: 23S rRNA (adenine(2503)-C(2))-methyltransferase RlmN [Prevotella sp.]|nr:23S rRNA (adenine(2503)-C(2))-methyltransferase RlmN [Prevotella sp.]